MSHSMISLSKQEVTNLSRELGHHCTFLISPDIVIEGTLVALGLHHVFVGSDGVVDKNVSGAGSDGQEVDS